MARTRDPVVCTCLTVRQSEIVRSIRTGARSLAEVGDRCEAGTGCHTCHPAILLLLEQEVHRRLARGEAPEQLQQLGLFDPAGGTRKTPPAGAARKPPRKRGQPDSPE